jgi:hypothetical protein
MLLPASGKGALFLFMVAIAFCFIPTLALSRLLVSVLLRPLLCHCKLPVSLFLLPLLGLSSAHFSVGFTLRVERILQCELLALRIGFPQKAKDANNRIDMQAKINYAPLV